MCTVDQLVLCSKSWSNRDNVNLFAFQHVLNPKENNVLILDMVLLLKGFTVQSVT